ncbi:MAG: hypothetical protein WCX61_01875 [Candidatus Peribacteraceae bacterium]|jgi:hypothetical protein
MPENIPTLDKWLENNYGLQKTDLKIRVQRLASNISRYSKENTRTDQVDTVEQWAEHWVEEVERSAREDDEGKDRKGVDVYLAESIQSTRTRLSNLGEEITLDQFPFKGLPESVRDFAVRALQKEIGNAIRKAKNLEVVKGAMIYADDKLTEILKKEFEA